jgi:DNA-binding IscR family transcriptional regulator
MCILTKTMSDALEAFFADLNRSTLADLAASRARLRERLGVPAPAVEGEAFA